MDTIYKYRTRFDGHTKGPWRVSKDYRLHEIITTPAGKAIIGIDWNDEGTVSGTICDMELAAAAPTMLEELIKDRKAINDILKYFHDITDGLRAILQERLTEIDRILGVVE